MEAFTEKMREHDVQIRSVMENVNDLKKKLKESDLNKEQLQQDLQSLKKNIETRTKRVSIVVFCLWIHTHPLHNNILFLVCII